MTQLIKGDAYILRTCNADMTSHNGFTWPKSGIVEAPDWRDDDKCRGGLHGFLWGYGCGTLADWSDNAVWIVARVTEWIDLGGKVKFPRAEVVFCGSRFDATSRIIELGAVGAVIGAYVSSGDYGTSTSGYSGTSISGYRGTSISGYRGTSISGAYGTSTSGHSGTSISGAYGTSTSGALGVASSGKNGTIIIKYYDDDISRIAVGYIRDGGIKPDTQYMVVGGEFVEVSK